MANHYSMIHVFSRILLGVLTVGALADPPVLRGQLPATRPTTRTASREAAVRDLQPRTLRLFVGQSRVVDAPWPVKRIGVNDPSIADVDLSSPRRLQIVARSPGGTEILLWGENGEAWQTRVEVEADSRRLQSQLKEMFPTASLQITQLGNVTVIKGILARAEQAAQLQRFMELSNIECIDATTVAGVQQVQLQVKVAEVSRTALRALGFNAFIGGSNAFGGLQLGSSSAPFTSMNVGLPQGAGVNNIPFQAITPVGTPPSATIFAGFPDSDLQVFIQALAENQYMRVLAEPTLIALSGTEANFLAGGEFPVPIAQLGGGGTTAISIEYREFGIRLRFQPLVLGDGKIHLHVLPEISELSDVGAVEVLGTRVPSILTRRVETTLQVNNGQTFAIAGLISSTDNARNSRVPGLGDLPIIGTLFRSVRYNRSETEMLVLVTASLVEPTSTETAQPVPGDLHRMPNDWEFYIEGRLNSRTSPPLAPVQAERLKRLGLSGLHGPGGWVTFEQPSGKLAGDGLSAAE